MRAHERTGRVVALAILIVATAVACGQEPPPSPPAAVVPKDGSVTPTSAGVSALMDRLSTIQPPAQGSRASALVREAMLPTAASRLIERGPGASGEQPLQRVGAEIADPTRLFPPVAAQVPMVWIGWYVNRSIDAFRQAIDENKPLVLVVAEDWCKYCVNLANDALRCSAVDRFAGDAVFAYSFPSSDRGAKAIATSLKIDGYPTITVLEPESRILLERGRINGYFESQVLGRHLETILWKTAPRVLPADWDEAIAERREPKAGPAPSTPRPGSAATSTSALFGAASRGLTHAPPAPQCQ